MRYLISLPALALFCNLPLIAVPYVPSTPAGISNPNVYAPASTSYTPPYSYSYRDGSRTVTNYYDPNAGFSAPPGLPTSPLDSRLNSPLGMPWQNTPPRGMPWQNTTPVVPIYSGPQSIYSSSLQPTFTGAPGYSPPAITAPIVPAYSLPMSVKGGLIAERPRPVGHFEEPTYLFPGLVRFSIDRWVGSDYLYDLPSNIGVVVELVVPQELAGVFSTDRIRDEVNTIFSNIGITPLSEAIGEQPPLPFFHLVAFIVPVEGSYVLSLSGRLFENVTLPRINFQLSGTWQAITWEKQAIIVSSKNQLSDQLYGTAKEIAVLFAGKVLHFRDRRFAQRREPHEVPSSDLISPFLHHRGACGCD
ncbi:MAG: hypothetical protein H0T62_11370 [Parachlamydiaceae bacterium]|nr:hypothetical protein [Parachlamydiaceae bacterium]